jgi:hypothetical protein
MSFYYYWGAEAYWYHSDSPDGFGEWYSPPNNDAKTTFTARPSTDGSGTTIDATHQALVSAQPAHLTALSDQWMNLYYLLFKIREEVYNESNTLYVDKWKGGKARHAYMQKGPGAALAYLDTWIDASLANATALQAMVAIIDDYRGRMEPIWNEYVRAVADAQNVSGWTKVGDFFDGDKEADNRISQTKDVQKKYNIKAQGLAFSMSQDLFGAFSSFGGGHGPLYRPPDAVKDNPQAPRLPSGIPGGLAPSSPPPAPAPAPAPPPPAPTAPPLATPTAPPVPVGSVSTPPGAPPVAPAAPPAVSPPGPMPVVIPIPPGLIGGPVPESAPPGLTAPGELTSPFQGAKVPGGSGLISRPASDLAGAGRLGAGAMPPNALSKGVRNLTRRPPSEPETPATGRRAGRKNTDQPGVERGPGDEDLFGGRTGATTPPVLNNKRRGRPNSSRPPAVFDDELSTGLPGHGDAVPPVLGRVNRTTPIGSEPAPALRAPAAPQAGIDDLPAAVRATQAQRGAAAERAAKAAPRELTNRNRAAGAQRSSDVTEPSAVPTHEEAFSVETPGGGVLTGRQDEPGRAAEPPAQVRAH